MEDTSTRDRDANIHTRINAVMRTVKGVAKSQHNPQGNYKFAGHEALTEALRGEYVKHGIVRSASILAAHRDGGQLSLEVEVSFINIDKPEDRHVVRAFGESPSMTSKGTASAVQSGVALSYAVKNVEFKLFALTGDTSPDAEEGDGEDEVEAIRDIIVDRYESAQTPAEINEARSMVEAEWKRVRKYKDIFAAAAAAAKKRVGVAS